MLRLESDWWNLSYIVKFHWVAINWIFLSCSSINLGGYLIVGLEYFKENVDKLESENREHMTCGFEIILPTLLQLARSLNIDVPQDFPAMKEIYARRDAKLKRYVPNY